MIRNVAFACAEIFALAVFITTILVIAVGVS
jgi:hypothetical protein